MSFKEYLKDIFLTVFVGIISLGLVSCVSPTNTNPCVELTNKIQYVNKYSHEYTLDEKIRIFELGNKGLDICKFPVPDSSRDYRLKEILREINSLLK